jgi:hypothetical protein
VDFFSLWPAPFVKDKDLTPLPSYDPKKIVEKVAENHGIKVE